MDSSRPLRSVSTSVFVDDGCSGFALIDSSLVSAHNISTVLLFTPYLISSYDRVVRGHITHKTSPLVLKIGSHLEKLSFLVTNLPSNTPLILGLPWMRKHNPLVNWRTLTFTFQDQSSAPLSSSWSPVPEQPPESSVSDIELLNDEEFFTFAHENSLDVFVTHMHVHPPQGPNGHTVSLNSVLTTKEYGKTTLPTDARGVPLKYNEFQVSHLHPLGPP
jgi:hypothetical protein